MKKVGFTLVELLIVIGIIALLMAILFPVLIIARKKASVNTCLSNMKNLGLGVQIYISDNDGGYPCDMFLSKTFPSSKYQGCPDIKTPEVKLVTGKYPSGKFPEGFGLNANLCGFVPERPPIKAEAVEFPTTTVQVAERDPMHFVDFEMVTGASFNERPVLNWTWLIEVATPQKKETNGRSYRHNDGANFVFCDGHAKWYQGDAVAGSEDYNDGNKPSFDIRKAPPLPSPSP
jgi:prepilin-type processing-associated H-X9-DG protein/prepilin-type N-terminal cleavage/methylation domain-containing protein